MTLEKSRLTPINSEYYTCQYCYVIFCIYPGDISPDIITSIIGISPTKINNIGDRHTNSIGRVRVNKISGWFLSTENLISSKDIREHLDFLILKIKNCSTELSRLQKVDGLKMSVNCTWISKAGHGGPTLWPEQMKLLSELNLECSFDVYFEQGFSVSEASPGRGTSSN